MAKQIGGRRVRDAEDADACLAAVEASGTTLFAWCCANDVAANSLYDWRRRLRRARTPAPEFVELALMPFDADEMANDAAVPAVETMGPRYEIRVGRYQVVVGDVFREDTLARILRVARSC
jgi:hypothetical protein